MQQNLNILRSSQPPLMENSLYAASRQLQGIWVKPERHSLSVPVTANLFTNGSAGSVPRAPSGVPMEDSLQSTICQGKRGDFLRLFALDSTTPAVIPLRDPDGKKLRREVESRHGSFLSRIDAVTLRASEWKEGKLWCQVSGTFSPKRQTSVHVPFHHLWVLKTEGKNPPVIEQEWTLTDPKERAYRDENR